MNKINSKKSWNKLKHNPLCVLDCGDKGFTNKTSNQNTKNIFAGECSYKCSRVAKIIYDLDKTNFESLTDTSIICIILSFSFIIPGLIMKTISMFNININNKITVYLKNIPNFGLIPIGLLLLFIGFVIKKGGKKTPYGLEWIILILVTICCILFLLNTLNTLDTKELKVNIPWEIMIRSYKLQIALVIISLCLFWLLARNITIPALMILVIVGLNIIALVASGTTLITSIVDFIMKYKDFKINPVKIEDKTELILNIVSLVSILAIIGVVVWWKKKENHPITRLQIVTLVLLVGSYILSFIEPTNYKSINKFIISIVTGNFILDSYSSNINFFNKNIFEKFRTNLLDIVEPSNTVTIPATQNTRSVMSEIYTVVKYTVLAAFMNDATLNTVSPIFTRTLFLLFTNQKDITDILQKFYQNL